MDDTTSDTLDQADAEELLTYTVSDEALEAAARGTEDRMASVLSDVTHIPYEYRCYCC